MNAKDLADAGKSATVERAFASEFPVRLAYIMGTALHLSSRSGAFAGLLAQAWAATHTASELQPDTVGHRWAR